MWIVKALPLVALIVAVPAWADWAPTKWGMDRDATIAALGNRAVGVTGKPDQRVAEQDWRAKRPGSFDGVSVEEDFYFNPATGGLSLVRLEPKRADCPAFIAAVRAHFRTPIDDKAETLALGRGLKMGRTTWTDQAGDLAIMMSTIQFADETAPYMCQLTFEPYAKREPDKPQDTL